MTEDEAKTKWCPFVRAIKLDDDTTFLRSMNGAVTGSLSEIMDTVNDRCIGSQCMAWRYWPHHPESGCCGLAGKEF